ncbi:MAG: monovalent cation/H+ antiporter complex subunit F [Algisphaera sp.]
MIANLFAPLLATAGHGAQTLSQTLPQTLHAVEPTVAGMHPVLAACVTLAIAGLCLGLALCLYRLVRGPSLTDRVLAADLLSLHVVGLVVVLTVYLRSAVFFDAALAVGILGFVSTVGFAQYIHAVAGNAEHPNQKAAGISTASVSGASS